MTDHLITFNIDENKKVSYEQKIVEDIPESLSDIQICIKNNHNNSVIVLNCNFDEFENYFNPPIKELVNVGLSIS